MKVTGNILTRCDSCRKNNLNGFAPCQCKTRRKYIVEYRIDGKKRRETVGYNKRNAELRLAEIISQVHNGTFFKPKKQGTRFREFAEKWLNDYAKPRVKERTYVTYRGYVRNHLNPYFERADVTTMTQEDIEGYLAKLIDRLNPNTVNKILKMLKTMFKYARRWKYREDNPAWDIDCFLEKHREMDYLNPEEIRLLLEHSPEPDKTIFLIAILTGMRKSEVLALQWGDIDWNSNTIYVRRSLRFKIRKDIGVEDKRWWFDSPKTRNSVRAIIMSPRLKEALDRHRFNQTVEFAQKEKGKKPFNTDELIFTNGAGSPVDPDNMVKRIFHPALERAGLRKVRFHDLRHTFASLLIDQGENLKFIQSQLGHAPSRPP